MFLALVREPPSPAHTPKNLLAGGTGGVHLHNKSTHGLEIPMAVSEASTFFALCSPPNGTETAFRSHLICRLRSTSRPGDDGQCKMCSLGSVYFSRLSARHVISRPEFRSLIVMKVSYVPLTGVLAAVVL